MKFIRIPVNYLVYACKGNPVLALVVLVILHWMFNFVEDMVQRLLWGEAGLLWFDVGVAVAVCAVMSYTVKGCAEYNASRDKLK